MNHVRAHSARNSGNNTVVATICDVDTNAGARGVRTASQNQGSDPQYVQDLRRVFDDRSINAVVIATPNHWHALLVPEDARAHSLSEVMKRLKGRTARRIRLLLPGIGRFWQGEWFDRWVRDDAEWDRIVTYIRNNPVKAGLAHEHHLFTHRLGLRVLDDDRPVEALVDVVGDVMSTIGRMAVVKVDSGGCQGKFIDVESSGRNHSARPNA